MSVLATSLIGRTDVPFPGNISIKELKFAKGTVGAIMVGAGEQIYSLKVKKGQVISLVMNSGGMRAQVTLFSPTKKQLGMVHDSEDNKSFEYTIPQDGNYYLVCYSGPTVHTYDFTVRVD